MDNVPGLAVKASHPSPDTSNTFSNGVVNHTTPNLFFFFTIFIVPLLSFFFVLYSLSNINFFEIDVLVVPVTTINGAFGTGLPITYENFLPENLKILYLFLCGF